MGGSFLFVRYAAFILVVKSLLSKYTLVLQNPRFLEDVLPNYLIVFTI